MSDLRVPPGEPEVDSWQARPLNEVVRRVVGDAEGRPWILAIDGRGAAGKSTLARRIVELVASSALIHTDDIAWHEPFFEWGPLLREHVLEPLHRAERIEYGPAAWERMGRVGQITVPEGLDLVVIEGTGANQREHAHLIDATIWVQSDFGEAQRRGIERDIAEGVNGDPDETETFWHEWMAHEVRFFEEQRPWERADVIVTGTPPVPVGPDEVAVAGRAGVVGRVGLEPTTDGL